MNSFIAKQPNGLYCRFSNILDTVTHYNFTKEQYINNYTETVTSKEDALETIENHCYPFDKVLKRMLPNNVTEKEIKELINKMSQ